ncbi:MAG: hypothetical protein VKS61_07840 [Candidatus Sericytochromatia bacterium]|nr:hypothetical protein [Candidatus Sericytochromatia bacterium]
MTARRALAPEELEHLGTLKGSLDGALNGALLTAGLTALPVGFVAAALRGGGGAGDPVALVLAAGILGGLTAAVVWLGGARGRAPLLRAGDLRLRARLAEDLAERQARAVDGIVSAKHQEAERPWYAWRARQGAPRRCWLEVAGERLEVTPARWLATPLGLQMAFTVADRSGVVLAIDGVRERLPLTRTSKPEGQADIIGLPVNRNR